MKTLFLSFVAILIVGGTYTPSNAAVTYERISCRDKGRNFDGIWRDLVRQERGIDWIIYQMLQNSGRTPQVQNGHCGSQPLLRAPFTNCVIDIPKENGRLVRGERWITADIQWYVNNRGNLKHNGIRIVYQWNVGNQRKVQNTTVCRSVEACRKEGIPFRRPGQVARQARPPIVTESYTPIRPRPRARPPIVTETIIPAPRGRRPTVTVTSSGPR